MDTPLQYAEVADGLTTARVRKVATRATCFFAAAEAKWEGSGGNLLGASDLMKNSGNIPQEFPK